MALAIAIANLIGSISSCLGSGFITITYFILPNKRHFRHSLILNLAIADFITSTNNTISGLWRLANMRDIPPGPECVVNGFIEQLSVQGTDTSIFAIAIITVWNLTSEHTIREILPRSTIAMICIAIWVLPITTSLIVLSMDKYVPVSGNWCWIAVKPVHYRYVMMHGWRFLFIIGEIIMYTYLHIYLRRRFASVIHAPSSTISRNSASSANDVRGTDTEKGYSSGTANGGPSPGVRASTSRRKSLKFSFSHPFAHRSAEDDDLSDQEEKMSESDRDNAARSRRVRRVLLLNAYPAMYILLWIPGIVNRLIEASGHSNNITTLLQSSTQFVGLANALTYGWNENVGKRLRERIHNRGGVRERNFNIIVEPEVKEYWVQDYK
ncbi:hypothetical protein ABW20_dc0103299 [Dactylellina cionopaga]|nr:hypothetical protein ABW20_dc0103299 [Dactylellina cionopaga]